MVCETCQEFLYKIKIYDICNKNEKFVLLHYFENNERASFLLELRIHNNDYVYYNVLYNKSLIIKRLRILFAQLSLQIIYLKNSQLSSTKVTFPPF